MVLHWAECAAVALRGAWPGAAGPARGRGTCGAGLRAVLPWTALPLAVTRGGGAGQRGDWRVRGEGDADWAAAGGGRSAAGSGRRAQVRSSAGVGRARDGGAARWARAGPGRAGRASAGGAASAAPQRSVCGRRSIGRVAGRPLRGSEGSLRPEPAPRPDVSPRLGSALEPARGSLQRVAPPLPGGVPAGLRGPGALRSAGGPWGVRGSRGAAGASHPVPGVLLEVPRGRRGSAAARQGHCGCSSLAASRPGERDRPVTWIMSVCFSFALFPALFCSFPSFLLHTEAISVGLRTVRFRSS